jgi:hypothetical protein
MSSGIWLAVSEKEGGAVSLHSLAQSKLVAGAIATPSRRSSRDQRKSGCRHQTATPHAEACLSELSQPLKNHRDETLARSLFACSHSTQIPPNYEKGQHAQREKKPKSS